jgi:tetratricopeptide (TPR) repeat protein
MNTKNIFLIKMRMALWAMLGVACLAFTPLAVAERGDVHIGSDGIRSRDMGPPSGGKSSSSAGDGRAVDGRIEDAPLWKFLGNLFGGPNKESGSSAADQADQQARAANEQGVQAYNKGDWATAIALFQQALQNSSNDPTYRQNLANAKTSMANQHARENADREAMDRLRQNKAAADNMQQSIQSFAQTLNATPVSGGLDFDGRTAGSAPSVGNSGGLDFTSVIATPSQTRPPSALPPGDPSVVDTRNEPAGLGGKSDFKGAFAKSAPTVPLGDPMVVDGRVPSGLTKALDSAIATAYSAAPPGVSDRVRKGFQAVMDRDWKVAKAWFQDALTRDPNNAGLKRFVALTDSLQQPNKQPATVDTRNEPASLGGRSDVKGATALPSKTKSAASSTSQTQLQLPDTNDIQVLFPGLKAMEEKQLQEEMDRVFDLLYKRLP